MVPQARTRSMQFVCVAMPQIGFSDIIQSATFLPLLLLLSLLLYLVVGNPSPIPF